MLLVSAQETNPRLPECSFHSDPNARRFPVERTAQVLIRSCCMETCSLSFTLGFYGRLPTTKRIGQPTTAPSRCKSVLIPLNDACDGIASKVPTTALLGQAIARQHPIES